MAKSYMGLILAAQDTNEIRGLTKYRPIASIPFAGRYRIIDFSLTNLTRVGISNVGIVVPHNNVRSLRDHIRGGQFWDLNRKNGGIFLMHPSIDLEIGKSNVKNFRSNLEYLRRSTENHVVLCSSHLVANIDLRPIKDSHEKSGKDLTLVYKKIDKDIKAYRGSTSVIFNENKEVEKFGVVVDSQEETNVSLEIKIIRKDLLIDLLMSGVQSGLVGDLNKFIEFSTHKISTNLYEFTGYTKFIDSTKNYFKANKDILKKEIREELLLGNGGISTKINDTPPAIYKSYSKVSNSLIANGCIVRGSVKDSIIGRRVVIKKGATIENSIILQSCVIEEGVEIKNVILDKNVTINRYQKVIGSEEFPLVIEKKSILDL
ncbi:glucose-1-phosphate adenylyltransferase subunit GlgD [Psychrilyobacter sp.]|uniref:glucose-1-phosphate adenylyltransferase subunit GlgD n=1 Tax=Psychrilyobacter sp. TaxID=2586924 RepID=UPI003018DC17